jgi:hypothetical protein
MGRNEGDSSQVWIRRHDEYEPAVTKAPAGYKTGT